MSHGYFEYDRSDAVQFAAAMTATAVSKVKHAQRQKTGRTGQVSHWGTTEWRWETEQMADVDEARALLGPVVALGAAHGLNTATCGLGHVIVNELVELSTGARTHDEILAVFEPALERLLKRSPRKFRKHVRQVMAARS